MPQQSTHLVADSFTWITTKGTKTLSFSESLLFAAGAEAATTVTVTLIDCVSYILAFDHNAGPLPAPLLNRDGHLRRVLDGT